MTESSLFNFFAYLKGGDIRRISLSSELQRKLTNLFGDKMRRFVPEEEERIIKFDDNIGYKPNKEEVFLVSGFHLPSEIAEALRNPVGLDILREDEYEHIKFIFYGIYRGTSPKKSYVVAFTVFDTRKIIPGKNFISIFLLENTFNELKEKLLVIDERVDALFREENLYFRSLYSAKRIFGELINEYYREATDEEVEEFKKMVFGEGVGIPDQFLDQEVRKLIFGIYRSGMHIDSSFISRVVKVGKKEFGLNLELSADGKIVLPKKKKDFKMLIKLINDDLLESPLTGAKYETNSKRKIK